MRDTLGQRHEDHNIDETAISSALRGCAGETVEQASRSAERAVVATREKEPRQGQMFEFVEVGRRIIRPYRDCRHPLFGLVELSHADVDGGDQGWHGAHIGEEVTDVAALGLAQMLEGFDRPAFRDVETSLCDTPAVGELRQPPDLAQLSATIEMLASGSKFVAFELQKGEACVCVRDATGDRSAIVRREVQCCRAEPDGLL